MKSNENSLISILFFSLQDYFQLQMPKYLDVNITYCDKLQINPLIRLYLNSIK